MEGCFCFANLFDFLFFPLQKGTICSSECAVVFFFSNTMKKAMIVYYCRFLCCNRIKEEDDDAMLSFSSFQTQGRRQWQQLPSPSSLQ